MKAYKVEYWQSRGGPIASREDEITWHVRITGPDFISNDWVWNERDIQDFAYGYLSGRVGLSDVPIQISFVHYPDGPPEDW